MPVSITLQQFGFEGVKRGLAEAGVELRDVMSDTVEETTELMETAAKLSIKEKDLLFRRLLLNSVTRNVSFEGGNADFAIVGRVWSEEPYAEVMDLGRRPGRMPPSDALVPWVQYRFKVAADKARGLAFVIARSIGKKGIKGRGFFKAAADVAERNMPKILDRNIRAWLQRVSGGGK